MHSTGAYSFALNTKQRKKHEQNMNDSSTIKMVVVSQKRKSEISGAGVKRTETAINNNNNNKTATNECHYAHITSTKKSRTLGTSIPEELLCTVCLYIFTICVMLQIQATNKRIHC